MEKLLKLPLDQLEWILLQFNKIESDALKKGYIETVQYLDKSKLLKKLLKE